MLFTNNLKVSAVSWFLICPEASQKIPIVGAFAKIDELSTLLPNMSGRNQQRGFVRKGAFKDSALFTGKTCVGD